MRPFVKGVVIAAVQVLLVAAVGGVLLYERQALPRVWALTTGVDPVLPIRGRYVSLRLVVEPIGQPDGDEAGETRIFDSRLSVEDGRLVATLLPDGEAMTGWRGQAVQRLVMPERTVWALAQPIAFFLPEDAPDPTLLEPGQELWAEVTVPDEGPPRPIRLEAR